MRPCTILQINPTRCTILLSIFISLLYMFRATTCPSSGEITVSVRHWYLSLQPADQTPPIQSDKYQCRTDTVISPDDGHVVARNTLRREINILSRIVHLVGFICKITYNIYTNRCEQRCTKMRLKGVKHNIAGHKKYKRPSQFVMLTFSLLMHLWLQNTVDFIMPHQGWKSICLMKVPRVEFINDHNVNTLNTNSRAQRHDSNTCIFFSWQIPASVLP